MKPTPIICLCSLFLAGSSLAEPRTFTSKEGKTLTAELVLVEKEEALLKLANSSRVKVPLASLSEADQKFIKSWWEENKNNITEMDVRLVIEKISKRVSSPDTGSAKGKKGVAIKKMTIDKVRYTCVLKSYTPRDLSNITVDYTVYKRVSTRGGEGSGSKTEETSGSATIASLLSNQSATFETKDVTCEDSTQKGSKNTPASSTRETVIGLVMTLSANGKEFLEQSYPENFLGKLKEGKEREADE